ncbi:MAG: V-type ATPase 116kDa subunit family protein [Candidatus Thermoplasmatota archaeon]|nr:V-type ATPase 116kDa subunit family protein [Candidatus Thermoplasmatota archaeon]
MSQVNTQQMGRLVAAGSVDKLDDAVNILARLEALHIIDYDGSEEGFSLGSPNPSSEEVGKVLVRARSAASIVSTEGPDKPVPSAPVRKTLSDDLPLRIDELLEASSRVDDLENEISALEEEMDNLSMVSPLGIDIELLGGYESISSFVGTVSDAAAASEAAGSGLFFQARNGNQAIVAVFCRSEDSATVSSYLESAGFESIALPEGSGSPSDRLEEIRSSRDSLVSEKSALMGQISEWEESNGEMLACGLEVLERDHDVLTAPVRIAVSEHAFVLDGWLVMSRAQEVQRELNSVCLYTEVTPFEMEAGGGGHGHSDHDHHQEMPPIAFQDRNTSKPMELLTDAVGRPAYGRIDPTVFMMVTYPIFFGIMLGDMAYGLITMGLGWMLIRNSGTNEMLMLGGKFLTYIGFGTLVFGYIYAEFAGWEIFPHHSHNPAEALSILYPSFDYYHFWHASLPLGIELAFPFHRVTMVEDHGNLEHLILLTIYLGVLHVFLGLSIGFRDIMLYGNGHGGFGFVCAFFEKGVWMILLVGGFMFAYGFLGPSDAEWMLMPGAAISISATVMLMWTLYNYHGVPFPINIGLAPIEAVGMMPTVISYVRLFAVGVVGVKIAETGNEKLFEPLAHILEDMSHASTIDYVFIPLLLIGWLSVQFFAWGLGVFSPNIHAARLHFVEWMRQYYDSSGEEFKPFGLNSRFVEVD